LYSILVALKLARPSTTENYKFFLKFKSYMENIIRVNAGDGVSDDF
jgi:hypothetical protein